MGKGSKCSHIFTLNTIRAETSIYFMELRVLNGSLFSTEQTTFVYIGTHAYLYIAIQDFSFIVYGWSSKWTGRIDGLNGGWRQTEMCMSGCDWLRVTCSVHIWRCKRQPMLKHVIFKEPGKCVLTEHMCRTPDSS